MKSFADTIRNNLPEPGTVNLYFMGQAGFILQDEEGYLIAYDLYLSNCCDREFGFKRLMSRLLEADELVFDAIICSHGHYDHLDIDSAAAFLSNEKTHMYVTQCGMDELQKLSLISDKVHLIQKGDCVKLGKYFNAEFVFCDHGSDTPYAVGTVFTMGNKKFYTVGDSAYREELINDRTKEADIVMLPINGAFGNLNETEAAFLSKNLNAGEAIPCHFWNFAQHGGNPDIFIQEAQKLGVSYRLMRQGECMTLDLGKSK